MAEICGIKIIKGIIPHRFPMRFIDKVAVDGKRVTGFLREIIEYDPIFQFKERNLSYLEGIEACAQTAAFYVLKKTNENGKKHGILFTRMENILFNQTVPVPLATAQYEAIIEDDYASIRIYDKDNIYLEGKITCAIILDEKLVKIINIVKKKAPYNDLYPADIFPVLLGEDNTDQIIIQRSPNSLIENQKISAQTLLILNDLNPATKGHFEDNPILPGIFEIFGADQSIKATFGAEKLIEIEAFEFLAPILPPSRIDYIIEYLENGKFNIEVYTNEFLAGRGILRYDYSL